MVPKIKSFTYYWLPLIAYCVFIYFQSSYPPPEELPSFQFSDKMLHFAAYAVMGVLFYRAYHTLPIKKEVQWIVLLSMISASLYGVSDEIHQSIVPERDGSFMDVIADVLGAVCGVYLYHRWMMAGDKRRQNVEFGSRNAEVGKRIKDRMLNSEVGMRKSEKG
jgi:VanZ family protein